MDQRDFLLKNITMKLPIFLIVLIKQSLDIY